MKKYQQGDVLILEITDEKMKEIRENGIRNNKRNTESMTSANGEPIILAFGEATGHTHQIKPKKGDVINHYHISRIDYSADYKYNLDGTDKGRPMIIEEEAKNLQILADEVTIYHEEHNPLTIPRGNYEVRIVREFDHMTQRVQRVWD